MLGQSKRAVKISNASSDVDRPSDHIRLTSLLDRNMFSHDITYSITYAALI